MKETYRKVSDRLWTDAKFMAFDGQTKLLWLYLLTSPHAHSLPGLFRAGAAEIRSDIGLDLAQWTQAWGEIEARGMAKADWPSRVIWLKNAVAHNPPDNISVLHAWAKRLYTATPESDLRDEAARFAVAHISRLGPELAAACRALFAPSLRSGRPVLISSAPRRRETYRRVYSHRLWADEKFGPMPIDSKLLWLYLITGPNQSLIPGLFRCGESTASHDIGISDPSQFRAAWSTIESQGMAIANWARKLVWLPQALRYGWPRKAETLVEWGRAIDGLPECDERDQASASIQKMARMSGPAFVQAYKDGFLRKQEPLSLRHIGYSKTQPAAPAPQKTANRSNHPAINGSTHTQRNGSTHQSETVSTGEMGDLFGDNSLVFQDITEKEAKLSTEMEIEKNNDFQGGSIAYETVKPLPESQSNGYPHPPLHTEYRRQSIKDGTATPPPPLSDSGNPTDKIARGKNDQDNNSEPMPSTGISRQEPAPCPEEAIIGLYHELLPMLPKVLLSRWRESGTESRKHLQSRWREGWRPRPSDPDDWFAYQTVEDGLAVWREFFMRVSEMPRLTNQGGGKDAWRADFRWLIVKSKFTHTLEGRYPRISSRLPTSAPSSDMEGLGAPPLASQEHQVGFDRFCSLYPAHRLRAESCRPIWLRLMAEGVSEQEILSGLESWRRSSDWAEESGRFVPNSEKWLMESRWKNPPALSGRIKPTTLSANWQDGYSRFAHHVKGPTLSEDKRALRFEGGLYALGEDCLILSPSEEPTRAYQFAMNNLSPFGQIVDVKESQLPRRAKKMLQDQRNGLYQSPPWEDYPILPEELPEFPSSIRQPEKQDV